MKDTEKSTNMQEKKRLRLYVTAALLALTLVITSAWAVSLYANYRAGVNGGDEARVAKFVVETAADSANPTKITLDQIATADGETLTYNAYGDYKFTVKNSNESGVTEVATAIGVVVTFPSSPYAATVTLITADGTEIEAAISEDRKTYTFANVATANAGEATEIGLTLRFTVAEGMWGKTVDLKKVKIGVLAEQID